MGQGIGDDDVLGGLHGRVAVDDGVGDEPTGPHLRRPRLGDAQVGPLHPLGDDGAVVGVVALRRAGRGHDVVRQLLTAGDIVVNVHPQAEVLIASHRAFSRPDNLSSVHIASQAHLRARAIVRLISGADGQGIRNADTLSSGPAKVAEADAVADHAARDEGALFFHDLLGDVEIGRENIGLPGAPIWARPLLGCGGGDGRHVPHVLAGRPDDVRVELGGDGDGSPFAVGEILHSPGVGDGLGAGDGRTAGHVARRDQP